MGLSNKQVGPKLLAKIQIYILTRAELLFTLCSEIPSIRHHFLADYVLTLRKKCLARIRAEYSLPAEKKFERK